MKKPEIKYNSRGESGNIFCLLTSVADIMRKQGRRREFEQIRDRVFGAKSYEEALEILSEEATLTDTAE